MKKRKVKVTDFISQLSRIKANIERQDLLSFNEMKMRFKSLEELIRKESSNLNSTQIDEEIVDLRLAYLMMGAAFKSLYGITLQKEPDKLVDKYALSEEARKMEERALRTYAKIQSDRDLDLRRQSGYRDLGIRERAPITSVEERYANSIKEMKNDLGRRIEKEDFNEKKSVEAMTTIEILKNAINELRDPEYKLKLDEVLLFNFNPNQAALYKPRNFADITYMPERKYIATSDGRIQEPSFMAHNSDGDEIIIIQTADLGFGRQRKPNGDINYRDPYNLKEYRIIKKYKNSRLSEIRRKKANRKDTKTTWDENENGEVFTVYGNINTTLLTSPNVDRDYVRYNNDVLLSTTNLEEAVKNNGGYIGEIAVYSESREYVVIHNMDSLCLAKEFEKIKVERKARGEPISGIGFAQNLDTPSRRKSVEWGEK